MKSLQEAYEFCKLIREKIEKRLTSPILISKIEEVEEQPDIIIDHGGMNIGKLMHFGHLRSLIIGSVLKKIISIKYNIKSDVHLGDFGLNITPFIMKECSSIEDMHFLYKNEPKNAENLLLLQDASEKSKYKDIFLKNHKISSDYYKSIIKKLDIQFDYWFGEYNYIELCKKLLPTLCCSKEHSHVIKNHKGDQITLTRTNGTFLYFITDFATLYDRVFNLNCKEIIYIADERQSLHFNNLFKTFDLYFPNKVIKKFIPIGVVKGDNGKPLSSRDINQNINIHEIIGPFNNHLKFSSLIFNELRHKPESSYNFSGIEHYKDSGIYIIYTLVRLKSLLRKSEESEENEEYDYSLIKSQELINLIVLFPKYINSAIDNYSYINLFKYLCDLCKIINSEYHQTKNLKKYKSLLNILIEILEVLFNIFGLPILERI